MEEALPGRTARFNAWTKSLTDHPEATNEGLDAFYRNLYGPGFTYDAAHPFAIAEEVARLAWGGR